MFENLEVFRVANQFAQHTERQHSIIARNIANADTPGYRAVTVQSFSDAFSGDSGFKTMRATRQGHIQATEPSQARSDTFATTSAASPNGNSVSLETEMMKATDVRLQHDLALSVYSSSLNILKTSLGRGR
ncbi:MAG: FlgB family protein [Marinosulfonomonas sp.]